MVAGSDVVQNASSYRKEPEEHSIHTFPHILFRRESGQSGAERHDNAYAAIQGGVVELKLPTHFEDISSTPEHIFERFVKLDKDSQGVGLGLTISRMLARMLGGDISLDTTYSRGARFVFTLPYKGKTQNVI